MIMKSLKFWRNWFHREEPDAADPDQMSNHAPVRKPPAAITVRAAMRQKQKMAKASG